MTLRKLAALLAFLATGCFRYQLRTEAPAIDPTHPPPAGLGQICVVRPSAWALAVTFVVRDNGRLVGATRGPSYFCYWAEPGLHRITTESDETAQSMLVVSEGGCYYLHQRVENVFGWVRARMEWVDERAAAGLMARAEPRTLAGVPGDQQLPGPYPVAPALAY